MGRGSESESLSHMHTGHLIAKCQSRRPEHQMATRKGIASVVKMTKQLEGKSASNALLVRGLQPKRNQKKGINKSSSANPLIYSYWSKYPQFTVGDSLFFLYPPSQDSVIQVTEQAFNECNLKDPILYMDDGNSLFNISSPGRFYFTSGVPGHCETSQKLQISVLFTNGSALPPSYAPTALPDTSPSYPTTFGSIPAVSSSLSLQSISSTILAAVLGVTILMIIN
ncbi:hypothetical protein NE237_001377 [Protea cynaroides]|uniref:Phytocyanin domain-containing protein n=1 Tax=Protea cynaroides TaxID=273540 RepID=A0A9Q0KT78_9MAGN|nr:hypothetical protein NE237_001377 [Protea cynaroides]